MSGKELAKVIEEMIVQVSNGYHVSDEDHQRYLAAVALVNSTMQKLDNSR